MKPAHLIAIATLTAFGGLAGAMAVWSLHARATAERSPAWVEMAWPFPIDQWGRGKAFQCSAKDCGSEVNLYLRAKIGFCNCTTGVADDEELDRISDFELLGTQPSPQGVGRAVKVAWMKGRSRSYSLAQRNEQSALSVGLNDHCDAIVATAVTGRNRPDETEPAVLEFLNSRTVLGWAEVALGL